MIYEYATLSIASGQEEAFEAAFQRAPAIFERGDAISIELRRCIETPSRYLLLVGWKTLEDHTVRFRESPLFAEWRGLVSEFFSAPPSVEHYETR